jgi:photosystem II stability/assembly factor-like uncharacterized protein
MNEMTFRRSVRHGVALALALGLGLTAGLRGADLSAGYDWKPLKIGGGGWVTGIDVSPAEKALAYCRTDVSGAYRWDAAAGMWRQIVTDRSLPPEYVEYGRFAGVDSIVGAPSDANVAYMAFSGKPWEVAEGMVFRSEDRGETWKVTGFAAAHVKFDSNGEGRQEGERLAVDPRNSAVVYYATHGDGLWMTRDAGVAWARVPGIPAGEPPHGVNTVTFDPRGGTAQTAGGGTLTKVIYVTVDKGGVFRSEDAGATWARISDGGPGDAARPRDAAIGSDGAVYIAADNEDGAAGAVWMYTARDGWRDITPRGDNGGTQSYWAVAVSPHDPRHVVVLRHGGMCFVSFDQGATWAFRGFTLASPDVQWQGKQTNYFLSVGELAFDPFERDKLWFAEGFGVWQADSRAEADTVAWRSVSRGIEEACGNDIIAPPGGAAVGAMWDLGFFRFPDPDSYNAERSQPGFMSGWALDWCATDPAFLVGVRRNHLGFAPHPNSTGYSEDGGKTWRLFPAVENAAIPQELEYGVIAVSANNRDTIVWAPAQGKLPYATRDRGVTWAQVSLDGVADTGLHGYSTPQKPLCADRVLPDTFYFYRPQDGVYRSTDGGANFRRVGCPAANRWNAVLKSVPGRAGELWFAEAIDGGAWHSSDGGATWTRAPGVTLANNIGLGKAQRAGGYPTVFIAGVCNGERGIFRSVDGGATWDRIGGYPLGIHDFIDAMDGDKDVFGRVYVCFCNAGFAYGSPRN